MLHDYLADEQVHLAQEHIPSKEHEHLIIFKNFSEAVFVLGGIPIAIRVFDLSLRTQPELVGSKVGGLGLIAANYTAHLKRVCYTFSLRDLLLNGNDFNCGEIFLA